MKDEDSQLWKKHSIEDIFKIVAKDLRGKSASNTDVVGCLRNLSAFIHNKSGQKTWNS